MNIEQTLMGRAKYWYPRVWQREMWQNMLLRVQQNICYESFSEQNICKSDSLCPSLLISGFIRLLIVRALSVIVKSSQTIVAISIHYRKNVYLQSLLQLPHLPPLVLYFLDYSNILYLCISNSNINI